MNRAADPHLTPAKISAAAREAVDPFRDGVTEAAKQKYLESLSVVRRGLSQFIADPDVAAFLDTVLDSEMQSVPHIVCDGEEW